MEKSWFPHAYRDGPTPWVTGTAGPHIVRVVTEGIVKHGSRVLDVGCSCGTDIVFMALQGMQAVSLDTASEALAKGRALAGFMAQWWRGHRVIRSPCRTHPRRSTPSWIKDAFTTSSPTIVNGMQRKWAASYAQAGHT